MESLTIYPSSINQRFIEQACDALRDGGIIVYPTDSLYAIGCDALNQKAIERVCQIKNLNPQKNTLSIICADISQAAEYARIDNAAYQLLRQYTPGPFTFILPAATTLPTAFKGRRTVGIRIPDNAIARALCAELGNPLLTTSIPTTDEMTEEEITYPAEIAMRAEQWQPDLLIDGGEGSATPSTIVDLTDSRSPEILRQGLGHLD